MAELTRPDGAVIHYEIDGEGPPLLALAPGGVTSSIKRWAQEIVDPALFGDAFTLITMDQRYGGASRAPLTPFSYAQALDDQLAVLDATGFASAHVIAADLGCAHALRLLYDAPARVNAAVLIHPVGLDDTNTMDAFYDLFNDTIRLARAEGLDGVVSAAVDNPDFLDNPAGGPWAQRLHDEPAFRDTLRSLGRENYIALIVEFRDGVWPWQQPFFSVNEVALGRIDAPVLVLPGHDTTHPSGLAERICAEIPHARALEATADRPAEIRAFLKNHNNKGARP